MTVYGHIEKPFISVKGICEVKGMNCDKCGIYIHIGVDWWVERDTGQIYCWSCHKKGKKKNDQGEKLK